MTKIKEIFRIIFRKDEEDVKVKVRWSLRKKLLVGATALGGLILGVFAYGKYHEDEVEDNDGFDNEDFEELDDESDEDETEEFNELLQETEE